MPVAAPQSNSSQNHKENQRKDHQDRKEVACQIRISQDSDDYTITRKYLQLAVHAKHSCLTVADDGSTVQTAPRAPLVTQRRSPAGVTVAIMIVVAQLVKENIVDNGEVYIHNI